MNVGAVFLNPVMAGDAAIQIAVFDVSADFLRPNEPYLQLLIIHRRRIGAAAHRNIKARLGHLLDSRFLQTALGQPKP